MGEMMTISEDELREHLRASADDLHSASLTGLADDALRQARRGQRTARTAVALAAALFVVAAGVTASTFTTTRSQHTVAPASTATTQQGSVKLLTPIRFFRVLSYSNGACKSGGYTMVELLGTTTVTTCFQVDSAHGMSVSELAQIKATDDMPGDTWVVELTFLPSDKAAFAQLTAATTNNELAIVIDGKVVNAPLIQESITSGTTYIASDSQQSANNLVKQLTGR
jgi:hypothetical protein